MVVAHLHHVLTQDNPSRDSRGRSNALLLAALNFQLAQRLLDDLGLAPQVLTPRRWRWELHPRGERIRASEIAWTGMASAQAQPLPRTRSFLTAIPDTWVRQALAWAPPVVQPTGRNGTSGVVANHISALLARQRLPSQWVRVRRLQHATTLQRSLPEICQGLVHVLAPLYTQHRQRIAELAPDDVVCSLLTGYSRAQYFRIKDAAGG